MTRRSNRLINVQPGFTRPRRPQSCLRLRVQIPRNVPVMRAKLTSPPSCRHCHGSREMSNRRPHGCPWFHVRCRARGPRASRHGEWNLEPASGHQHQATPVLRNPIVGHLENLERWLVSSGFKTLKKVSEHAASPRQQPRDILHHHRARPQPDNEACHFQEQFIPWITSMVLPRQRAEPLARCAPGQ